MLARGGIDMALSRSAHAEIRDVPRRPRWRSLAIVALGFVVTPVCVAVYATLLTKWLDRDIGEWARHEAAVEMTRSLFVAVDYYRRDNQRVPSQDEGLDILAPQYVSRVPIDPWGRPFDYRTQSGDWADIVSLGADGEVGGDGPATDISARYGSPGTTTPRTLLHLFFVLLLLIPATAYAVARGSAVATPALAGIAAFWACAVTVTIAPGADLSMALVGAFAAVGTALTGAVLSLRGQPGGTMCTLVGTVACQIATAAMMT